MHESLLVAKCDTDRRTLELDDDKRFLTLGTVRVLHSLYKK